jgi:hypothetical protein
MAFALVPLVSMTLAAADQKSMASLPERGVRPVMIVGFTGGFVRPDDPRHSEAQIARRLGAAYGNRVEVQMFANRQRAKAHRWILDRLGVEENGKSLDRGQGDSRIILFGHSWGASAAIYLAREIEQDGVADSLTIQVDSITKNGRDDSLIPPNVAEAMNFYQPRGILHGRPAIKAADPTRTRILGNVRLTYEKAPPECRAYPWYDRLLFKDHTAIECDPSVWSRVETLIKMRLESDRSASVIATKVISQP